MINGFIRKEWGLAFFWGWPILKMSKKMKNEIGSHCLSLFNYFPSISTLFDFVLFYYQLFSFLMH